MFAEPDILMPYQIGRNSLISFSSSNKPDLFDQKNDQNRSKHNSHLQMTWVQDSPKNSKGIYSESTFLTNVNSISSLDPVVQNYVDQQIPNEFSKLLAPYKESVTKLQKMIEANQAENLKKIDDLQQTVNAKIESIDLQTQRIEEINKKLEDHEKRLNCYDQKLSKLESKNNSSNQEKAVEKEIQQFQKYKEEIRQKFQDLQDSFTNNNVSTLKIISHLEEKANDCPNAITTFENKLESQANELNIFKNHILNVINKFQTKTNEELQQNPARKKTEIDKYALKTDLASLSKSIDMLKQNIKESQDIKSAQVIKENQCQKALQVQLYDLKEKIALLEKKQSTPNLPVISNLDPSVTNEIKNCQKDLENANAKFEQISKKIEQLEISIRENNGILITYSSIPLSFSTLKTDFEKSDIFFKNEIKDIKNDIKMLKFKTNNRSIQNCDKSIDIPGTLDSESSIFNLTIGEPDLINGEKGIHLCLSKSYQDYTFNFSKHPDPEDFFLKEPSGLKSARRKIKSRKFKKS